MPTAGSVAYLYEGMGPGRCNCTLVKTYPYAFAPRLGLAYQITPKTVLRAGWGIAYASTAAFNYIGAGNSQGMGFNTVNFTAPQSGVPIGKLSDGLIYDRAALYVASYNPGLLVTPGAAVQGSPSNVDPNGGRPPRINQWNISLQREVIKNLVAEAAYVGNRTAWLQAGGNLINYNIDHSGHVQGAGNRHHQPDRPYAAQLHHHFGGRRGPRLQEAVCQLPRQRHGSAEPEALPAVQRRRRHLDSARELVVRRFAGKGHQAGILTVSKPPLAYAFSKTLNSFNGNGNMLNRGDFKSLDPNDRTTPDHHQPQLP